METAFEPAKAQTKVSHFPRWLKIFEPTPPAPPITDPALILAGYSLWRNRVLLASIIGYATFYLVRENIGMAMPVMEKTLGLSKIQLGTFLTLNGVLYGVSKFINGFFADRCNARSFMSVGLAASALLNVAFGFNTTAVALGVIWLFNGWFQGMGFPPCARLMTHWFPPKQLATKMSVWNISHSIGAMLVLVLSGYLATMGWQMCFFVPAAIALLCSVFLWFSLADTPESVGLPEVAGTQPQTSAEKADDFKEILIRHVLSNQYIWLVSFANFFVYVVRYGLLHWGPSFFTQSKHISFNHTGWIMAGFEFSGLLGMLACGWVTDRVFGGRGMRTCFIYMGMAAVSVLLFWKASGQSKVLNISFLCASGFFIYGPQALVSIIAANLATKRAAATAGGLTGLFGYASTTLSGTGLGALVQTRGWDAGMLLMVIAALIGMVLFAIGWAAKADGYGDTNMPRRPQ